MLNLKKIIFFILVLTFISNSIKPNIENLVEKYLLLKQINTYDSEESYELKKTEKELIEALKNTKQCLLVKDNKEAFLWYTYTLHTAQGIFFRNSSMNYGLFLNSGIIFNITDDKNSFFQNMKNMYNKEELKHLEYKYISLLKYKNISTADKYDSIF